MDTKMEVFRNQDFGSVRIIQEGDKYLFCGIDVCRALGYSNPWDAVKRHCKSDGLVKREVVSITTNQHGTSTKQANQMVFLSEGNVYRLIAHSKLPSAEKFESWVFDEVLPTIRKHGAYATDSVLNDPELWEKVLQALNDEKGRRASLEIENEVQRETIQELLPKASYYDIILHSASAVPITLFAKDYGMSATRMNRILHALDIQYRVRGCWLLYQKYAGQGFTVTHTYVAGPHTTSMHTCWTQKGRVFLYELLAEHGILSVIEMQG